MLVRWLVFIHVLSALTFFLTHGAAAAMVFKVRSETDFVRIRAMLDLAVSTFKAYMLSFLIMGLTGLAMPFLIHIWNKVWIWLSSVLILFVAVWMGLVNEKQIKQLRRLVGLPYLQGNKEYPAEPPSSPEKSRHCSRRSIRINGRWSDMGFPPLCFG
jgi:hypothetical protein